MPWRSFFAIIYGVLKQIMIRTTAVVGPIVLSFWSLDTTRKIWISHFIGSLISLYFLTQEKEMYSFLVFFVWDFWTLRLEAHLICWRIRRLDWWSRAGSGTGARRNRNRRRSFGLLFNSTSCLLLLLFLLGLPTRPLIFSSLSVLFLLLPGNILKLGLNASCAAASWMKGKKQLEKWDWGSVFGSA